MGKTKKEHEKAMLKIIKEHGIVRIEHIFPYSPNLKKKQFYNLRLHESHEIKTAIEENRCKFTSYLLKRWLQSDNATLQIAAMRLVCSSDEHRALNQHYADLSTNSGAINIKIVRHEKNETESE